MKQIRGACPHDCPDTCGILTEIEEGRAVRISADPAHPVSAGWLCAKVRPYLDHVYHPDRILHPLRRIAPKSLGQTDPNDTRVWQRISWDEALSEIASRWNGIIEDSGPEAILPYSYSGTLGMLQMGVASSRFWDRLGASQLERSICGSAAEKAVEATLGKRHSPSYSSLASTKTLILWGHNPVSTAPHLMPHIAAMRRAGGRLIVIDPRRTRSAKQADLHLAPRPATDGALALGIAHILVRESWHDPDWLEAHALGWPEFEAVLADYPTQRVAQITGLAEDVIYDLARAYALSTPSLIRIADGLQRHPNGGQTVRAIACLPALSAQYGIRGGGLAYSNSGALRWAYTAPEARADCPPPARIANMNRLGQALVGEVQDPPIQSLFVFGANPVCSSPNADLIVRGLLRKDLFTVVHELFMTDTAQFADIVLPATSQLEQVDIHKAYGHTQLTYNAPAIAPLGEAKSNWDTMRALAQTMGFEEKWLRADGDAVIDEILRESAKINPGIEEISAAQLRNEGTIALPVDEIPFQNGAFPTESGKVEFHCRALAEQGLDPLPRYVPASDWDALAKAPSDGRTGAIYKANRKNRDEQQSEAGVGVSDSGFQRAKDEAGRPMLNLIAGAAHHFVSSSLANQAGLRKLQGPPRLEIHPADASLRGIEDGQLVEVGNRRGRLLLPAKITDDVREGLVACPKGYWRQHHGHQNLNSTTPDALGDLAGQSTFHTNWVWVRIPESESE